MNDMKWAGRHQSGFTLIEMMIVVAIIAILMTVALPAYQDQMKRGIRTAAQGEMMDIANRQQQYLLSNRSYFNKTTLEATGFSLDTEVAKNYNYTVVLGVGTSPTYTITLTPYGNQASESVLTLNEQGTGTPTDEWNR